MNILLACSGGVSTGLIAEQMLEVANSQGKKYKIWAVDVNEIGEELQKESVDIILIGPQIRFRLKNIQKEYSHYNIPILCINGVDYGMNDAKKILMFAEENVKKA